MMRYSVYPALLLGSLLGWTPSLSAKDLSVKISPSLESLEVAHQGRTVRIQRDQNPDNTIDPEYAKTSRPCPPFCLQPGSLGFGVETVAELEVLDYLEKMTWGEAVLVVDSRTPDWVAKGTIPGSVNIPADRLELERGSDILTIKNLLTEQFGVEEREDLLDFSSAKTLVLFCNGPWCGQSSSSIATLLSLGYPPHKLKWYRGGMQDWHAFGLTVAR